MAVDIFLKIDEPEIEGESSDHAHEGEMDVVSWAWGMSQSGTMHIARGGGAGKVSVQDLHITKYVDKGTANLMLGAAKGTQYRTAVLTCRKAGGDEQVEYLKIEMENVIISSVSTSSSTGDDRQMENITLNFAKFKVTYTPQDNDGSPLPEIGPVGWDIQRNEEI